MSGPKTIYQLGHAAFSITHADPDFEPVLNRLLPHCDRDLAPEQICDVQMGLSFNIYACLIHMINQHDGCLMIQAACIVSPSGQKILISGAPNSGKTTLALALAFGYDWKVIAEDMTIIDATGNKLISLGAPFNLKPGTRDVLCQAGIDVPGFILREWCPITAKMLGKDCDAKFTVSIHLDGETSDAPLLYRQNTISEQTRKILPISNLLSVRGTDQFMNYLPEDSCHNISGGSLPERLQKLLELAAGIPCATSC